MATPKPVTVLNDGGIAEIAALIVLANQLAADVTSILAALAASTITGYVAPTQTSAVINLYH